LVRVYNISEKVWMVGVGTGSVASKNTADERLGCFRGFDGRGVGKMGNKEAEKTCGC
jgi:hypothetical protein